MFAKLGEYAKAVTTFVVAAYTGYQAARLGVTPAGEGVTVDEWIAVIANAVTLAFATWVVPNAKPEA